MKKLKYFAVLMIVALLTLTGCSITKGGSSNGSAEDRLKDALNNLAKAESFTVKLSAEGEIEGVKGKGAVTLKVAKEDKYYNLYADVNIESAESDPIALAAYLLSGKKNNELYLGNGDSWSHITITNDEVTEASNVDVSDYADGFDEKDIKEAMESFKSIKAGKTKNGITEIIVTVDPEKLGNAELKEDLEIVFLVDKKNNLTGLELDIPNYEEIDFKIEIKDINNTKVSVPKDVKNNAEEMDEEELFTVIFGLLGMMNEDAINLDYDVDYADDDEDYTTDEIFEDILFSATIYDECDKVSVIDFKNYNKELLLDDYDVTRIEAGELTFTKVDDYCEYEVTQQFVIDGKSCTVTDKDLWEGTCE